MTKVTSLNGDEQQAAEELDAFLAATLSVQNATPADELWLFEAAFAAELVELAEATRPDPAFLSRLGAQLERTALQRRRLARWSFLQTLNLARRPTMAKRTAIALAGATALVILVFLAMPLLTPQPDLPSLPSLAALSAYAQGGSGASGNPFFPGTEFVLKTTLPAAPERISVDRLPELKPLTVDEFRRLAERFGLRGTIYQEKLPANAPQGLTGFAIFDGSRQMTMLNGDMAFYADNSLANTPQSANALAFQPAAAAAKDFLHARGLLEMPYRIEPVPGAPTNNVQVARLLDGRPLQNGEIRVTVAPNGQVASVSFRPVALERVGEYPIRSAQAAWEGLVSGKLTNRIQYSIRRDPPGGASVTQTRSWRPEYRSGQRADVYGSVMVYLPTQGSAAPLIKMNGIELRGQAGELADQLGNLHVWGTMAADGTSLSVTGWGKAPDSVRFQGTLKREGKLFILRREDSKTFLLSNTPDDLPDGIAVSGYGRETNRVENGYPVLDWMVLLSPPDRGPDGPRGTISTNQVTVVEVQPITPTVSLKGPTPVPPTRVPTGVEGFNEPYIPPGYATPPLSANQRVEGLVGHLSATIYESVDGKSRALFATLADKPLGAERGWIAKLRGPGMAGIEKYDTLNVRVWGKFVLEGDQPTIQVERYEKAYPNEQIQAWLGQREPGTVEGKPVCFFKTREGERLVLAYSIGMGPDSCRNTEDWQTIMEGVVQPETLGGYRVVEMLTAHSGRDTVQMTDLKSYQIEPRPRVVRPPSAAMSGKANVEQVELVYYLAPITPSSTGKPADPALRTVQPLWKFTGHTQDGASFEILVQAVADQYVK